MKEDLRPLVIQMLFGGDFIDPKAFKRPLDVELVDRCEGFLRFNWPDFKAAIESGDKA